MDLNNYFPTNSNTDSLLYKILGGGLDLTLFPGLSNVGSGGTHTLGSIFMSLFIVLMFVLIIAGTFIILKATLTKVSSDSDPKKLEQANKSIKNMFIAILYLSLVFIIANVLTSVFWGTSIMNSPNYFLTCGGISSGDFIKTNSPSVTATGELVCVNNSWRWEYTNP